MTWRNGGSASLSACLRLRASGRIPPRCVIDDGDADRLLSGEVFVGHRYGVGVVVGDSSRKAGLLGNAPGDDLRGVFGASLVPASHVVMPYVEPPESEKRIAALARELSTCPGVRQLMEQRANLHDGAPGADVDATAGGLCRVETVVPEATVIVLMEVNRDVGKRQPSYLKTPDCPLG